VQESETMRSENYISPVDEKEIEVQIQLTTEKTSSGIMADPTSSMKLTPSAKYPSPEQ